MTYTCNLFFLCNEDQNYLDDAKNETNLIWNKTHQSEEETSPSTNLQPLPPQRFLVFVLWEFQVDSVVDRTRNLIWSIHAYVW